MAVSHAYKWFIIGLFVVLFGGACVPATPVALQLTASPSSAPTAVVTTALSPSPVSTAAAPAPTRTPRPTETAIAESMRTSTDTPPLKPYLQSSTSLSPDKTWAYIHTDVVMDDEMYLYQQVQLQNLENGKSWLLVDKWAPWGPSCGYQPFYWSKDGKSFYYSNWCTPSGCAAFLTAQDIYRVNLDNGENELLIADSGSPVLSPDQTQLAYFTYQSSTDYLVVFDLSNQQELRIPLNTDELRFGGLVWSPSQTVIIYTILRNPCQRPNVDGTLVPGNSSIIRVDLSTEMSTTIIANDERMLISLEWQDAQRVLVIGRDGQNSAYWYLNPTTGELTPSLATPVP